VTRYPEVSIVVPVRNGADTIADCVDSLLALDYPSDDFEVLVVDNDSTDGTPAVLGQYGDRVRLLHEPSRGRSQARNTGVRHARGDVIVFTDADCRVDRNWLTEIVPAVRDEDAGLVGGRVLAVQPSNYVSRFGEKIHDHERAITTAAAPYVITANCAARKSTLDAIGGFDPALPRAQDADISFRLVGAGYRLVFLEGAVVYHRNERTLRGLMRKGFQHGFAAVRLFETHPSLVKRRTWIDLGPYRRLAASLPRCVRGPDRLDATCRSAFELGKAAGKTVGWAWFRTAPALSARRRFRLRQG
jgi:cellulose synthase/poly-beta-1,6-N-acetylglucosamine synthase-like glycosyltransferase